jgi:alpha-galactosidase
MSPTAAEMASVRRWVAAKLQQTPQAQESLPGLHVLATYGPVTTGVFSTEPLFSFVYGGKPSAELLKKWDRKQSSRKLDDRRTEHTLTFTNAQTGLVARCVAVEYGDFPTVEWTVYLKNTGKADTPIIESLQALHVRWERGVAGEFTLHHHTGDNCTPDSYQPHATRLEPGSKSRFAPTGGCPTTGAFPYFNLEWPGEGVIVAIGWPGQWEARFVRDEGQGRIDHRQR